MGYINIFASSKAHVSVKKEQLLLQNDAKIIDYPLRDVSSVMIENLESSISTYALAQLAEHNILVFICNRTHLPCGMLLPYNNYYLALGQYQTQISVPPNLPHELWQSVVKNKINNQGLVLTACGVEHALADLENTVTVGDITNNEAKASLVYFKALFGNDFIRRDEKCLTNILLNYGYAIVRGFVARSVVAHGLLPFLGINHCNQLNNYNLADDLMEVFRPVVDLMIKQEFGAVEKMTSEVKQRLYNVINVEVKVGNNRCTLEYAIECYVQSFVKSLKEQKNCLKSIQVCGVGAHKYE